MIRQRPGDITLLTLLQIGRDLEDQVALGQSVERFEPAQNIDCHNAAACTKFENRSPIELREHVRDLPRQHKGEDR